MQQITQALRTTLFFITALLALPSSVKSAIPQKDAAIYLATAATGLALGTIMQVSVDGYHAANRRNVLDSISGKKPARLAPIKAALCAMAEWHSYVQKLREFKHRCSPQFTKTAFPDDSLSFTGLVGDNKAFWTTQLVVWAAMLSFLNKDTIKTRYKGFFTTKKTAVPRPPAAAPVAPTAKTAIQALRAKAKATWSGCLAYATSKKSTIAQPVPTATTSKPATATPVQSSPPAIVVVSEPLQAAARTATIEIPAGVPTVLPAPQPPAATTNGAVAAPGAVAPQPNVQPPATPVAPAAPAPAQEKKLSKRQIALAILTKCASMGQSVVTKGADLLGTTPARVGKAAVAVTIGYAGIHYAETAEFLKTHWQAATLMGAATLAFSENTHATASVLYKGASTCADTAKKYKKTSLITAAGVTIYAHRKEAISTSRWIVDASTKAFWSGWGSIQSWLPSTPKVAPIPGAPGGMCPIIATPIQKGAADHVLNGTNVALGERWKTWALEAQANIQTIAGPTLETAYPYLKGGALCVATPLLAYKMYKCCARRKGSTSAAKSAHTASNTRTRTAEHDNPGSQVINHTKKSPAGAHQVKAKRRVDAN